MTVYPYALAPQTAAQMGLIVLQSDESIEDDFRALIPPQISLLISRVPSALEVTPESLCAMEGHLAEAAGLFPQGRKFDVVGYGCTSGTSQIGADRVAARVREGISAVAVTNPVSALIAASQAAGAKRIGFLSPYVETVSDRLREVLAEAGIETPVFGSFAEAEEAKVARIDAGSIRAAAQDIANSPDLDAIFLSCTNLRTLSVIPALEKQLNCPVWSSNLVLAWDMVRLAAPASCPDLPGGLLTS